MDTARRDALLVRSLLAMGLLVRALTRLLLIAVLVSPTIQQQQQQQHAQEPGGDDVSSTPLTAGQVAEGERKLSEQVMTIIEHYRSADPVGLPGAPVDDPMPIPDMRKSFSLSTMTFKNASVYGLSKFRIDYVNTDLTAMQVTVGVTIDLLEVKGLYTLTSFVTRSNGNFFVNLTTVHVTGLGKLEVQRSGQLQAEDINMDIKFDDISLDFQNLGFMGSFIQGIINSIGSFLFDSIKPFILQQVNTKIRGEVNKNLLEIPQRFPNSIPPLDMAIAEARKYVRDQGYDPYHVDDYHYSGIFVSADITHVWITGLASFHRVGNISVNMTKTALRAGLHIGTGQLEGKCHWEVGLGGVLTRPGSTSFTVDYLQANIVASQPLDVRKTPTLEDLDLNLGNIQMRFDGAGTLDYAVEFAVNILPNILRYQIVNAFEKPLKKRVQEVLDSLDIEGMLKEKLPELDRL